MRLPIWRVSTGLLGLLLMAACGGGGSSDGPSAVTVTVQGQYEKRTLSASGVGTTTTLPTRYSYAQVVNSSSGQVVASGTLDGAGTGTFTVPKGITFYVALYASIEVPTTSGSGFYFYGEVKKAVPMATYASAEAFNQITPWTTISADVSANTSGTLALRALDATGEGAAFAIADQMATFALGMRGLEPTLQLPELYAFWMTGTTATSYPTAALGPGGTTMLTQSSALGGRAIFQHSVRYAAPAAADRGADAYNDSALQEAFARLLFADGSLAYGNGTYGTIVRRDNDNAFVLPADPSEPAIAFVSGFSSFLSSAFRNDPASYDIPVGGGLPTVFRLDQHTGFTPTGGGEFYPGSVARTLWGIWKNPAIFNGTQAGLQTMWKATNPAFTPNDYEFGKTPLACYPTYLTGLKRLAGLAAATPLANELALENVGNGTDPTSSIYLNGPALWTVSPLPISASGSFSTNGPALGYFYDWDTAQAFRFVQGAAGPRTLTLTTPGSGLLMELFDTFGLLTWAEASSSGNGVINRTSLPAGTYVVRVRVDPLRTYASGTISYGLTVN
ncbi:hypothetical protein [Geothrix edaphica]|uniref:Peptidase C-terminal archaeal/bacterial domain-containing protein n=1 Tax=Geothrix edaphica TaxID=2927976 RepID=A0ABQ5PZ48_9BACT|nr:hypothetical protein [Geothrix edaphica]GLH67666.1 hypothetical protein GETHED_20300 [Geothrix edaphica]